MGSDNQSSIAESIVRASDRYIKVELETCSFPRKPVVSTKIDIKLGISKRDFRINSLLDTVLWRYCWHYLDNAQDNHYKGSSRMSPFE